MPKRVMYTGGFGRQLDLPEEIAADKGDDGKIVMRPVERTGKGALHLRPGRVHVLTDDELKLALEYKDMKRHLRVVGEVAAPKPKDDDKKAPATAVPSKPERKPIAGRRGTATADSEQAEKPKQKAKASKNNVSASSNVSVSSSGASGSSGNK